MQLNFIVFVSSLTALKYFGVNFGRTFLFACNANFAQRVINFGMKFLE